MPLVAGEGVRGHKRGLGVALEVRDAGGSTRCGQPGVVGVEEGHQRGRGGLEAGVARLAGAALRAG